MTFARRSRIPGRLFSFAAKVLRYLSVPVALAFPFSFLTFSQAVLKTGGHVIECHGQHYYRWKRDTPLHVSPVGELYTAQVEGDKKRPAGVSGAV